MKLSDELNSFYDKYIKINKKRFEDTKAHRTALENFISNNVE